jgi:hypothetical protein
MKFITSKTFALFTLLAVAAFVVTACLSEKQANDIDNKIDTGTKLVNGVLVATGNGAAAPVVAAGGALAKWVVGLFVSAGAGAGVVQHVHAGFPMTERRARLKSEDERWDDLLAHVQHSLPALQQAAVAAGHNRAAEQAARVQAVLAALNPPTVAPAGSV